MCLVEKREHMKISRLHIIISAALLFNYCASVISNAVTYEFSNGRFGDNLISYIHGRWIAYKYGIELLYRPFPYSDQLQLHKMHNQFDDLQINTYNEVVRFPRDCGYQSILNIKTSGNILYIVPYFPHCKADINRHNYFHFDIDWSDRAFLDILRKEIAPIAPLPQLNLPKDRFTLAVHVRVGSAKDKIFQVRSPKSKFADKRHPLKFPPDEFFVSQIKKISELLNDEPMYVYIFTDSSDPKALLENYRVSINKSNITYGCREKGNHHEQNVLEDFFAFLQFDCLIRGESNFAIIPDLIGKHKIVAYPLNYQWDVNKLEITEVETTIRDFRCIPKFRGIIARAQQAQNAQQTTADLPPETLIDVNTQAFIKKLYKQDSEFLQDMGILSLSGILGYLYFAHTK